MILKRILPVKDWRIRGRFNNYMMLHEEMRLKIAHLPRNLAIMPDDGVSIDHA